MYSNADKSLFILILVKNNHDEIIPSHIITHYRCILRENIVEADDKLSILEAILANN